MKYIIWFFFIASAASIGYGYFFAEEKAETYIGFGVAGIECADAAF